ncbi:hypothetical protein OK016_19940 [Vibrio chagasii]|nr:hypothetical protein [Vibrio chagasii]
MVLDWGFTIYQLAAKFQVGIKVIGSIHGWGPVPQLAIAKAV